MSFWRFLYLPCRDRPVCIPTPGVQLVTLSHVEDVASMLACVPGNPAAIRQYYNVCSDRQISFTGGGCGQYVGWGSCRCGTFGLCVTEGRWLRLSAVLSVTVCDVQQLPALHACDVLTASVRLHKRV